MAEENVFSHTYQLKSKLDFTADELKENQAGRLSPRQSAKLIQNAHQELQAMGLIGGVTLLTFFTLGALGYIIMNDQEITPHLGFYGILLGIPFLVLAGYGITVRQEQTQNVVKASGILTREIEHRGRYSSQYIVVDRAKILERAGYEVLVTGQSYTLYYLPENNLILSAEHIGMNYAHPNQN